MLIERVNTLIREMIQEKIEKGWFKTSIGKVLLGSNGQAHLNHFLKLNENGTPNNFGIKPLNKIARAIDYEIMIAFVPKDQDTNGPIVKYLEELNFYFINKLSTDLSTFLNSRLNVPKIVKSNSSSQIDIALDQLLGTGKEEEPPDIIEE